MPTNALRCPPLVWLASVGGGLTVWSWVALLEQWMGQMVSIIVVSYWVVHDTSDKDRIAHGAVVILVNLAQLITMSTVDFAHGAALILVNLVQVTTMSMVGICRILTPVSCRGGQRTQHNEIAVGECGGMVYASRRHTLGCRMCLNGPFQSLPHSLSEGLLSCGEDQTWYGWATVYRDIRANGVHSR